MLLVVDAIDVELDVVRLIAIRVNSHAQGELDAFKIKGVIGREGFGKAANLPALHGLACNIVGDQPAALIEFD